MLTPTDDQAILLNAMGEYQDRQRLATGESAQPTMVCADWAFHEDRTGFDRDRIRHLLPQLVAGGLAQGLGTGMVWGYRVGDGYAWISQRGQQQLATWRQPPPPYQAQLDALGPDTADRLHELLAHAAAAGVTQQDIDRLDARCRVDPGGTAESQDPRLADLLHDYLLPFLRSIVAS